MLAKLDTVRAGGTVFGVIAVHCAYAVDVHNATSRSIPEESRIMCFNFRVASDKKNPSKRQRNNRYNGYNLPAPVTRGVAAALYI
jgi:hypothetical protein